MSTVVDTWSSYTVSTVQGGEPLGMENGAIADSCITASSSSSSGPPHMARLNGLSAWCAGSADDCFLQIDLGFFHLLCGVATQGNPGGNRDFVKRYKLLHSTDGSNWKVYEENGNNIVEGNTDNWNVKRKDLDEEFITRFVRICPLDWYCWPCLRCELYGAALNIGDKFAIDDGGDGGYVVEKVLVTTEETHVQENGVNELDDTSLKEQEKKLIREAKERQRKEEEQANRLEEIRIIIEQEEDKRKQADEEMDKERREAEDRLKLVLGEEKLLEEKGKLHNEDFNQPEEDRNDRVTKEYNRIDLEHQKRMEELTSILEQDEERRQKEREERRVAEQEDRKKRKEERKKREEEMKRKREEERLKWEEEHRKWEEDRKKRDKELEEMLEEGRKKRAEERQKREEELRRVREEERAKREEDRKKRLEEEMRKLEDTRKEREESWNKKAEVVIATGDLSWGEKEEAQKGEQNNKNRFEEKKKKEEGWMRMVETPRHIEEEIKTFRNKERNRIEEERRKTLEKEFEEAERERELKSEIRALKEENPDTITRITVQEVHLSPVEISDPGEAMRRIEWRMEKLEHNRVLREEEDKKRQEEAERKREEERERMRQEEKRKWRQEEEERERRKEELRLRKEAEEKEKREEAERKRQEEEAKRLWLLEEKKKRLEEERKRREIEEGIWRREAEERRKREEEEMRKQDEIRRKKRLSIERKKLEEGEKKRLDEIVRKRSEEEEKGRIDGEKMRREEREQWKQKQVQRRRSGEIYRRKSEEDLRQRGERFVEKEQLRRKRDSKNFETKWIFISGEPLDRPDASFVSVSDQSTLESEPPDVFLDETFDTKYVTVRNIELRRNEQDKSEMYFTPIPAAKEKETSRTTITTRRVINLSSRSYSGSDLAPKEPCSSESHSSIISLENGDVTPYRSQPRCDHLLPDDPAVKEAEEWSFFSKFDENDPKLRPFPSWYGGLDMGSLPHLYFPSNPIQDSDIDRLLDIENEGLQSWRRVKKSGELEIYTRKALERGSPPITKAVMVLKDIPYRDAIDLITDWDERANWDKTFDGVSFLDQMGDFKVLKCSLKKKNRCAVLASLDREEEEEPYYAWAWKGASHPGVPGEDTKVTVMRLETEICGAIIRPYHDGTKSCKITLITQVRGSVPSPLRNTYLSGNPSKWLVWAKKHHASRLKDPKGKDDSEKQKDDSSSISSKSDKQE